MKSTAALSFANTSNKKLDTQALKIASKSKASKFSADSLAAAQKLRNSKVIANLKSSEDEGLSCREDATRDFPLRFSMPLTMDFADRLISMPVIQVNGKSGYGPPRQYFFSCNTDLSIWHQSDDAHQVVRQFTYAEASARNEFNYLAMWALNSVLPSVFEMLISGKFLTSRASKNYKTLGLACPIPYEQDEPPFTFAYGRVFGRKTIHPMELVHTFISGATGVGKTYGGVKPLMQGFLIYKNAKGQPMGMLVIDPKSELLQVCATELEKSGESDRLFRLGQGKKITFFQQEDSAGLEDRYRKLAEMVQVKASGEGQLWQEKGNRLNINMAQCDRFFQTYTGVLFWGVVRSIFEGKDYTQESQWGNILAVYKIATNAKQDLDKVAAISQLLLHFCPQSRSQISPLVVFTDGQDMLNQLFYRVSNAEKVCSDLSAFEISNVICTDLYPAPVSSNTSIENLLSEGKVIVLQPKSSYFGDIAGRLIKSRFFDAVLTRTDMLQPMGYVADEFQRFITSDRDTGEQSFLDRCRAYRVNCVLSSQSLSSIEHALVQSGETSPKLAVDIIVANSPTKIIYRSIDSTTRQSLMDWIPGAPGGRKHIVEVRPVAQLPTGLAYYMCDGKWGMYQYEKCCA